MQTIDVEFTNANAAGVKMMEYMHADGHVFTRRVFDEDAGICRKVQAGLESATGFSISLDGLADQVKRFQAAYSSYNA